MVDKEILEDCVADISRFLAKIRNLKNLMELEKTDEIRISINDISDKAYLIIDTITKIDEESGMRLEKWWDSQSR